MYFRDARNLTAKQRQTLDRFMARDCDATGKKLNYTASNGERPSISTTSHQRACPPGMTIWKMVRLGGARSAVNDEWPRTWSTKQRPARRRTGTTRRPECCRGNVGHRWRL